MPGYLNSKTDEVRYLLGQLSEEEEATFEKRYLADEQAFEELQIAESELIDAYVSDELSAKARSHLELRLKWSPRLRQRVAFARTFAAAIPDIRLEDFSTAAAERPSPTPAPLSSELASTPARRRSWKGLFKDLFQRQPEFATAMAACLALVLLGGTAIIVQSIRLGRESQRLAAERSAIERERTELNRLAADQNIKNEQLASNLKAQQTRNAEEQARLEQLQERLNEKELNAQKTATPFLATLFLNAGTLRSGGGPDEVKIPAQPSQLPLGLILTTTDYQTYNVVIRDGRKKEVFARNGLTLHRGKTLSVRVPTTQLAPGTYSVEVSGVDQSGSHRLPTYQFRVTN